MKTVFCLTVFGSVFTLILVAGKSVLLKKCGGRWYCTLWLLALLAFCVPCKVDLVSFLPQAEQTAQGTEKQPLFAPQETEAIPMERELSEVVEKEKSISAEMLLQTVYFCGLAVFAGYYGMVYVLFCRRQKRSAATVEQAEVRACFDSVKEQMGIRRKISLLESPSVVSPMLVGLFRPCVLLPVDVFDRDTLTMIFRHELTHYKRKDLLRKGAALGVHLLHWFNPFSYLALQNINEACEYACDAAVTGNMNGDGRREYGEMLLCQVGRGGKGRLFFAGCGADGGQKAVLKRRLGVIMKGNGKNRKGLGAAAVLALGLVIGGNAFPLPSIYGKEEKPMATQPKETKELTQAEAEALTVRTITNLFGLPGGTLEVSADWNENSDIQPDGWFVRASAEPWEYAAWINADGIMTKISRSSQDFPTPVIPEEKRQELRDETWLQKAEAVIRQGYAETRAVTGETSEIAKVAFWEGTEEKRTVDVQVWLEDGTSYVVSFYPNGMLKASGLCL